MLNNESINRILQKIGALISLRAKENCPVDMGQLRASIQYSVEGNSVRIFSNVNYARDMEYGRPPEPLSDQEKEDLKKWAERHNLPAKRIIGSIQRKGIAVGTIEEPMITPSGERPFLRPAVYDSISDIKKIIKQELQ
jgi:hypothetical protein